LPGQTRAFEGIVVQDSDGELLPGTTVRLPAALYQDWREYTAAQATRRGTPTPATKNAMLTLPKPQDYRTRLHDGPVLDLAMVPLRAERGMPGNAFRVLIVAEPQGSAVRPIVRLAGPLGWAALIAFLIAAAVALILARSVTRPLITLTRATRAVARGDYGQRVPVREGDEVGELGHSFNQMAQEIERTRRRERDFLANISHDLKTPLTSIQGFAGALTDGTVPPDAYPAVARIIHEEAQRMGQLVGDVLQLSRLEAGDLPLALGPLDAGDLLRETAHRFERRAAQAGIALVVDLPDDGALPLLADRGRLEQVLGNLIENAIRHTPSEGRIDLVAQSAEQDGRAAVRLVVRDTGEGIAPSDLPRIFERFYQADKARATKRAGSGLGLAIVKELVERHGGTIRAESTLGAGTAMIITLLRAAHEGPNGRTGERANRREGGVLIGEN
jgi:signal transduction histidine kinase